MPRFLVIITVFFTLTLGTKHLFAQNVDLVLKIADEQYNRGDYFGAIGIYEKALEIDSGNAEVLYKYGRNLQQLNNHKSAVRYLQKAMTIDRGKTFPFLAYELAESYRSIGDYRTSRRYYNQALRPYRKDKDGYWYQKINQSKKAASWATKYDNKTSTTPSNLGRTINGDFAEFGATFHNGMVYYSALIADSVARGNRILDKDFYGKIYQVSFNKGEKPKEVKIENKSAVKFASKHLANPSFHNDNIYFSVCDTNFQCEIWKGKLQNNLIKDVEKLNNNINNASANNTQPQIAELGGKTVLLFVSDRDKGFGGLDIWKANLESFGFDEAVNLGNTINTPGNEITPFFSEKSQELYFSSDWHLGYGGYDIFKSNYRINSFDRPENLNKGINSTANDYYFKVFENKEALLSSNRKDGNVEQSYNCCNDLFKLPYELEEVLPYSEQKALVNEEILNKYLPLTLYFHNDTPDPNSKSKTTSTNFIALANEYQNLEQQYIDKITGVSKREEKDDVQFEIETFFEEDLSIGIKDLKTFTPLLLQELEKGNKVVLTVRGYASSVSNSNYNLNLTLRRIESLINYFKQAENGSFLPYINKTATNGGSLEFIKLPYGELAVSSVQDEKNKIKAVYSKQAAMERKIELLAISSSSKNSQINISENPVVKTGRDVLDLGKIKKGEQASGSFVLTNIGKGELKIYNITSNLEDISIKNPRSIRPNQSDRVEFSFETNGKMKENLEIELVLVTNALDNMKKLKVTCVLVD